MQALVLVGHGSHHDPRQAEPVFAHADAIRDLGRFDEVREAFWKGEPAIGEVLRTVESDEVFVVPLLMSEGYFAAEVVPRELRIDGGQPPDVVVQYTEPVGTHDAMVDVILQRAETVTGDPDVGPGVGLAVVGHGTERSEGSAASIRRHAERIRGLGRFDEVRALFLDQEPSVAETTSLFHTDEIVVVPLFVSDGPHTTEDVPAVIGLPEGGEFPNPTTVDDRLIWYAGAVGTEPLVAEVVLERAEDAGARAHGACRHPARPVVSKATVLDAFVAFASHGIAFDGLVVVRSSDGFEINVPTPWVPLGDPPRSLTAANEEELRQVGRQHYPLVSNWFYWERIVAAHGTARRGYLRWLERADELAVRDRYQRLDEGIARTWGELSVEATITEAGDRRYAVRHLADRSTRTSALIALDGPRAVRDAVRFDDDDVYRPLAGARTLPTGWIAADLDGPELVRTVEAVYPVGVANWHRERVGVLDVVHYREAAGRQTGRYGQLDEVSAASLRRAIKACCAGCVRRRVWDDREGVTISIDRGESAIPCRTPCSVFLEAARAAGQSGGGLP